MGSGIKKINKQAIINKIESTQIRTDLPAFGVGDTIAVSFKVIEGVKTRIQRLEGVVIKIRGGGLNKNFILRRETNGIGNEITYNLNSPLIVKIDVLKKGKVRRAFISYMRERSGKSARIKSSIGSN
ncbi:MAG: 50S ribosomal protein L19 [Mycoplasmataceae bacterium]|jgi:large subunit ribosomal protein L19|nr:50S ribosomal protein L19 [Mycoplasmataceae bacterium]